MRITLKTKSIEIPYDEYMTMDGETVIKKYYEPTADELFGELRRDGIQTSAYMEKVDKDAGIVTIRVAIERVVSE